MPSLRIFEFKVVRFIPRRAAAPSAPAMIPCVSRSAARIACRSVSSRVVSLMSSSAVVSSTLSSERGTLNTGPEDENHRPFQKILEFSYVAWPVPTRQRLHRFAGMVSIFLPIFLACFSTK